MLRGKWRLARFDTEVPLRYRLLNPRSREEGPSIRLLRLGLLSVATLGFEMGICEEKPQDSKGAF
jgi:hypothetical protein